MDEKTKFQYEANKQFILTQIESGDVITKRSMQVGSLFITVSFGLIAYGFKDGYNYTDASFIVSSLYLFSLSLYLLFSNISAVTISTPYSLSCDMDDSKNIEWMVDGVNAGLVIAAEENDRILTKRGATLNRSIKLACLSPLSFFYPLLVTVLGLTGLGCS